MPATSRDIAIPFQKRMLRGTWTVPAQARGVVLFAHGSGSSRISPRNRFVATALFEAGFATLLMDLLSDDEEANRDHVFDIEMLAERMAAAVDWVRAQNESRGLPIGLFGASTGSAAALEAAVRRPGAIAAVVSRGGRPDLAWHALPGVNAPTLLIVGEHDSEVLLLNRSAARRLGGPCEIRIVPGATHLFEEPGALPRVAELARDWFAKHLVSSPDESAPESFSDRADAGRRLAARLAKRSWIDPAVLAIPRGGVIVGAVVAEALNAELDVVLARKLRMPGNPEYALGAIAETGDVHLNMDTELPPAVREYVDEECRHQMDEIRRRRELFRKGRLPARVEGRSVIVVDDGIATGSTMIAALHALRLQHPHELIVAVPVAAPDRLRQVADNCDETICLIETPELYAVGQFYDDFSQVDDEEVIATLERFADHASAIHPRG